MNVKFRNLVSELLWESCFALRCLNSLTQVTRETAVSMQSAARRCLADLPHNCLVKVASTDYSVTAEMLTVSRNLRAAAQEARPRRFEWWGPWGDMGDGASEDDVLTALVETPYNRHLTDIEIAFEQGEEAISAAAVVRARYPRLYKLSFKFSQVAPTFECLKYLPVHLGVLELESGRTRNLRLHMFNHLQCLEMLLLSTCMPYQAKDGRENILRGDVLLPRLKLFHMCSYGQPHFIFLPELTLTGLSLSCEVFLEDCLVLRKVSHPTVFAGRSSYLSRYHQLHPRTPPQDVYDLD